MRCAAALGMVAAAVALAGVAGPAAAKRTPSAAPAPSVDNVYWMVDCLIEVKDRGLEKVLSTVPGAKGSAVPWISDSAEEAARFASLRLIFSRCLPEGQTLRFGKVALRGSVAINYYCLAHAARTMGS